METQNNKNPFCFTLVLNDNPRFDCEYNHPKHKKMEIEIKGIEKKKKDFEVLELRECYIESHRGKSPEIYTMEGIPVLKVRNLLSERIDWNTDYTSERFWENNKQGQIVKNDVLIASTGFGSIGKVDIFTEDFKCLADGHITIIRVNEKVNPLYLVYYLRSIFGQSQIEKYTTGSTGQLELPPNDIDKILVLMPKDIKKQEEIVDRVRKLENEAQKNFISYHKILSEIKDRFSLELKIEIRNGNKRTFLLKSDDVNDRLDCYFNSPSYKLLIKNLRESEKNKLCRIIEGKDLNITDNFITKNDFERLKTKIFKYVDIGNTEKEFGEISGFEEDILLNLPTRARQVMESDDILIPRPIGSSDGIVKVPERYDSQLCSTGFIQIKPENEDDKIFLWSLFKSIIIQKQFFYLQSGSLQPEITPKNFMKEVLIPIIKDKEKIVKEAKEKINNAEILRNSYQENIQKSKELFINMLKA